jgi:hypothetical protein
MEITSHFPKQAIDADLRALGRRARRAKRKVGKARKTVSIYPPLFVFSEDSSVI